MTGVDPLALSDFAAQWAAPILCGLGVGYAAGIVHFRTLRAVADRLVAGDWMALLLQPVRFAGLGGVLFLLALWGGHALLAAGAGILLARGRVLSRAKGGS